MSELALKLIEKEKKEKTGKLDLRSKELIKVPKEINVAFTIAKIYFVISLIMPALFFLFYILGLRN